MSNSSHIEELSLETVMGDRFGRYSKYIIQERALPDIRDGLKPVQRRILYAMHKDGNTFDKQFRKSAKSVGNVMGNFHPHGDSSIYEAMVRMSQDWKLRAPLIEMHGNNGSIDNDPPAAMRYTEARLSKLAGEMLRDLDKETVDMVLNFDDTEYEPTVLPAHFPNLLVNGATGISAGYATEIPPHNLGEVIDALVHLIGHPNASLTDLMDYIKGPDFPTGAIIQGLDGIKSAYEDGRGRIIVRSRTNIKPLKGGKSQIEVTEIPYEVNKSALVKKLDEIRLNKDVAGITEVRDESDREGLSIVIELGKEANVDGILTYLFKKTDLQVTYNFNMVAIHNQRPERVGLKQALVAFLEHQVEIITKRTEYDLKKALNRQHIVTGLIKMMSILDQVIATIRGSKDRKDAKNNLVQTFDFTEVQAEAIVTMQLYRLTNTDVTQLEAENTELSEKIQHFNLVLSDPKALRKVLRDELKAIKKEYATPRLSTIEAEVEELKIDQNVTVVTEDVMLLVSKGGYVKRSSIRSYNASGDDNGLREDDDVVFMQEVNTLQHVFMITDRGNVIYRPVHEIAEMRWKEPGEHLSQTITGLNPDELIIAVKVVADVVNLPGEWLVATQSGLIKRTQFADLAPRSNYRKKATPVIKLKTDTDSVVGLQWFNPNEHTASTIVLTSYQGNGLRYDLSEVPTTGARTAGVKAMSLEAEDDMITGMGIVSESDTQALALITNRGAFKWMAIDELPTTSRARKGVAIMRELKKEPHRVVASAVLDQKAPNPLTIVTGMDKVFTINPLDYPLNQRYSNGSFVIDAAVDGAPVMMDIMVNVPVLKA
ncbi:DNA topoisomerase IV subunit A [Weissella tructae]|uniref:DNA topoisomerase 4 subunit A n=2 Tax=Weissella TaxID=46255 RepID=A0A075TYZ1_9LACO|nr:MULTISPECIES: DNA topoisomerase IV subunit A [Weissella]AIG65400.1 DNA topoisomerase 4 subunit A [Weissella tructae]AIM62713.1 DNA topoisomerase 4 subunit A [Weissella ceti]AIM64049.1 DNA topoisomerase 4 subunit A [Weissella ceti]ELA07140.1 DNA topoisomerase IV subunit A [Weissella ceti NC36]QVV91778.1 DNA topoisomerase IV subunit A [Weissella tructae]